MRVKHVREFKNIDRITNFTRFFTEARRPRRRKHRVLYSENQDFVFYDGTVAGRAGALYLVVPRGNTVRFPVNHRARPGNFHGRAGRNTADSIRLDMRCVFLKSCIWNSGPKSKIDR